MNASITAWLNQREKDYATGVLLHDQFGASKMLRVLFANGKSAYHLSRLIETLQKLNPTLAESSVSTPILIPAVKDMPFSPRIYSLTDNEWDAAPGEIKDLYTENSRLKSHSELLHHQIRITGSQQHRLEMALLLLDQRDKINQNWSVIKDFQATGKVAGKVIEAASKTIEELNMPELTAIMKNFPTYLSKDKAKLPGMADGRMKNKVLARIRERETILELAKKRIENARIV
jgi:hypothetical protein